MCGDPIDAVWHGPQGCVAEHNTVGTSRGAMILLLSLHFADRGKF